MIRVWAGIADDNKTFRSSVVRLLNTSPDIIVVGEAESGRSAIELVKQHRPDVLLMGSSMAGLDGYEAPRCHHEISETKVIIIAMRDSPDHWEKTVNAGALGFITKDTSFP